MPELPEVTTIVRDLNRRVRGSVVARVWTDTPKLVRPLGVSAFTKRVMGHRILTARRVGKSVLLDLAPRASRTPTETLVWHMRMTGHPLFRDRRHESAADRRAFSDPRNQCIRLRISFTDGTELAYSDVRRFGTLRLIAPRDLAADPSLRALGPDAFVHRWTAAELCVRLTARRKPLKVLLLDQAVIAGIGNIYADEILWTAQLHPLTRAHRLRPADCARLVTAMRSVLRRAIRVRGTSVDDYRDLRGRKGGYGELRRVYQRTGQPCFRCGATIARLVVGGRGTHICPQCQPRRL
jgi:formamidopyrimidine-DNA glycosylase